MQLLEHEAKALATAAGLDVPAGAVATDAADAERITRELDGPVMVKAQVPTGGRGRAGGVVPATSPAEAARATSALLTTPVRGHLPGAVLVERQVSHEHEVYLAVTVDARARSAVLLLGAHGGVDVEDAPAAVTSVPVAAVTGVRPWHVWQAAGRQLPPDVTRALVPVAQAAYRMFTEQRATLVELNPVLVTPSGEPVVADVRVVPEHLVTEPPTHDTAATAARAHGFDVVTLDETGDVGLVSTGAGGSLLLVDMLVDAGASPVNFCDLRTGGLHGRPDRIVWLLEELRRYPTLRCLAVNVFAGITDIAEFARTFARAVELAPPPVPVLVRVEGQGAADARRAVEAAGLVTVATLDELVERTVAVVRREPVA